MSKLGFALLWAIAAGAALFLIGLPISLQAQLIAGSMVVAAMIVLKTIRPEGVWRLISLALGTAIVLRYVYWRTTETIPPVNQLENFIPGILLYLAELYNVFMLCLSLFVVAKPLPGRVSPPVPADPPTVDIFVPTYNEDTVLLATTLAAAKGIDYPPGKMTIWLLDDGGTDQKCRSPKVEEGIAAQERRARLTALCADLGVNYLTRARNEHAKAGNLNNGLAHSSGDLIAVFDADHAPARDFLTETVGFFAENPKLFLVQTPHFFINPDPLERNLKTFDKMPSENEMFYGIIQRGLDKWDASFFCGSAAVLSRKALETTKGFSGISITEDAETALELHSKGWDSVYVDKPLIAGLQPSTFASFIGQRTRWAQGMMQILRFRFPPLKRGLSIPQRLGYMSSTLFWLFPISRTIFLIAPLFYLFFGAEIFVASGGEFMAYTLMYMIVNLMMQNYLYGRFRWPWISELYELIQSVYLLPALISVMLNPRKPTFKVTAKDETLDRNYISELGGPFYIIFAVLLAGVGMTVWRIVTQPYDADVALVVGGWNILNLLMVGCALGVVSERRNPQSTHRVTISRRCDFIHEGEVVPGTIEDVSLGGARVRVVHQAADRIRQNDEAAAQFTPLSDIGADTLPLTVRNFVEDGNTMIIGCSFHPESAIHYRLIADLIFANSKQWSDFQESRRVNIGIIRGSLWFLRLSVYQSFRGMAYLMRRIGAAREADVPEPVGEAGAMTASRRALRVLLVAAAALLAPAATIAQAPFDMSPEVGEPPPTPDVAPSAPPAAPAPSGFRPFDVRDGADLEPPPATPAAPDVGTAVVPNDLTRDRATDEDEALAEGTGIATPERGKIDRYLLSAANLRFEGETGQRSWGFSLAAEQAARAATLTIAFNSSIYVSPEDSLLHITINERRIVDQALAARENPTHLDMPIPPGTLRPGVNVITFDIDQRHRTDCTIQSTYDLWTEFEAQGTGLIFEGEDPTGLASLDDLPSVGLDATGRTRIHLIAPGGERAFAETDLARLVQAIVLRGNFRQAVISVEDGSYDGPPQGVLRLAVGTAAELSAVVSGVPSDAGAAPTVGFLDAPGAAPTLVISGPAWQDVKAAIGYVADGVGRPLGVARRTIDTTPIILPLVPLFEGEERLSLAKLGIATEEFSGRRFRGQFYIGLPGDFYSDAYGEATLYLDAAYTGEVQPGSHIDIYVNGFIAANTPLTSEDGDILQHLPIKVAMTHMRPGVNIIAIDAVLDTEADAICAPGTVAGGPDRFVLFDSSEFFMPSFGQIERWPDLSVLVGAGLPYARSEVPVPIVLGRASGETYGAALTFLSRIAVSAGRVIPVEMGRPDALGSQPAIFVGALSQFSAPTVTEVGVADAARSKWDEPLRNPGAVVTVDIDPSVIVPNSFGDSSSTEGVYDRWESELVSPSGIRGRWLEFERWLERNFDLSFASLAIFAGPDAPFDPSDRATLVVVQSPKSAGRQWTMVAGRNVDDLVAGVEGITTAALWVGLNGRVAAYDRASGVDTVAPKSERYVFTGGFSLDNLRLIAANWLSVNIVAYALALVLLCCILGICTSALLSRLGRRS